MDTPVAFIQTSVLAGTACLQTMLIHACHTVYNTRRIPCLPPHTPATCRHATILRPGGTPFFPLSPPSSTSDLAHFASPCLLSFMSDAVSLFSLADRPVGTRGTRRRAAAWTFALPLLNRLDIPSSSAYTRHLSLPYSAARQHSPRAATGYGVRGSLHVFTRATASYTTDRAPKVIRTPFRCVGAIFSHILPFAHLAHCGFWRVCIRICCACILLTSALRCARRCATPPGRLSPLCPYTSSLYSTTTPHYAALHQLPPVRGQLGLF